MKNKIFKLAIMLLCIANCYEAFAQFYDSHNCYLYIEMGKTIESSSAIDYYHFDSYGDLYSGSLNKDKIRKLIKEGILEEYAINSSHDFEYCSSTSTYKYEVYKCERTERRQEYDTTPWYPGKPVSWGYTTVKVGGYWYRAFSLDRSTLITWYTTKDSNEPINKKHYKRIDPDDLTPKEVDYDFLR